MKKHLGIRVTIWTMNWRNEPEPVDFYLSKVGKKSIQLVAFNDSVTLHEKQFNAFVSRDGKFWTNRYVVSRALEELNHASTSI